MQKAFAVRAIVFVEEQNCPYEIEVDGKDFSALHFLGEIDHQPFAAARMRFLGEYVKLERLAIRKSYRGRGYGNQLLGFMMNTAREAGFCKMKLHAQTQALEFYRKHGFQPKGDFFFEADIEHQLMVIE
jgi:predicted GNAT family N-acyltransferase